MGATRLHGVGRSVFLRFRWDKVHPAFRATARMMSYDFGMHRAGEVLRPLVLLLLLCLVLTKRVLCEHRVSHRQRKCARDYGCNVFSHLVWL